MFPKKESGNDPRTIHDWLSTVAEICAVLSPFLIATLVLWLDSRYVTKEEFAAMDKSRSVQIAELDSKTSSVEKAILILTEQQKENNLQDRKLDDHDQRIRSLEIGMAARK
jgi:hypothetical protein